MQVSDSQCSASRYIHTKSSIMAAAAMFMMVMSSDQVISSVKGGLLRSHLNSVQILQVQNVQRLRCSKMLTDVQTDCCTYLCGSITQIMTLPIAPLFYQGAQGKVLNWCKMYTV